MPIMEADILIRLILSCFLGGLIGLERESHDRPAGFRTHILVCTGSTLVMIVSMFAFINFPLPKDPGRIAAQVVSGVGFLGAGTIIREGSSVKGLTTAASLWVVAGIGLAVGAGMFFAACISTAIVIITLVVFRIVEKKIVFSRSGVHINLLINDTPGMLGEIGTFFGKRQINIKNLMMRHISDQEKVELDFYIFFNNQMNMIQLVHELRSLQGICAINKIE